MRHRRGSLDSGTRMRGGFRHLLVATSLPFVLPLGLHHVESWDLAVSEGTWRRQVP